MDLGSGAAGGEAPRERLASLLRRLDAAGSGLIDEAALQRALAGLGLPAQKVRDLLAASSCAAEGGRVAYPELLSWLYHSPGAGAGLAATAGAAAGAAEASATAAAGAAAGAGTAAGAGAAAGAAAAGAGAATGVGATVSAEQRGEWLSKYSGMESIVEALGKGDTVLIKGSWLLEFAPSCKPIPRRQDLPPGAAWDAEELGPLLLKNAGQTDWAQWEIVPMALSYCWATKEHPDPTGEQMQRVARAVRPFIGGGMRARDAALFIDYSSLYQNPRSDDELESFKRGLGDVNLWYAHREVISLLLTVVPEGVRAYKERGWPCFEYAVSGLTKMDCKVLDLGVALPEASEVFQNEKDVYVKFVDPSKAGRPPPCTPESFLVKLETLHFTNGSDRGFVAKKYRKTFEEIMGSLQELDFARLNWGVDDSQELGAALPYCKSAEAIDITDTMIGPEGAKHIAQGLPQCPRMRTLGIGPCGIRQEGLMHLVAALPQMSGVRDLWLMGNDLDDAAVEPLIGYVRTKLYELSLRRNYVTDAGAVRLANVICERGCLLKVLRLNENTGVTDASVEALCVALRQSPCLKTLDLRSTSVTAAGHTRLRAAAEQRGGVQVLL